VYLRAVVFRRDLRRSCGSAIGLVLGLKNRRDILDASDDRLGQIEELKG
jgi:hypothetical protein